MPVWLRNFTYREISDHYEKEKEAWEKANGKETITANTDMRKIKPPTEVKVPDFVNKVKKPINKRR